jgi:hypothetical protein
MVDAQVCLRPVREKSTDFKSPAGEEVPRSDSMGVRLQRASKLGKSFGGRAPEVEIPIRGKMWGRGNGGGGVQATEVTCLPGYPNP